MFELFLISMVTLQPNQMGEVHCDCLATKGILQQTFSSSYLATAKDSLSYLSLLKSSHLLLLPASNRIRMLKFRDEIITHIKLQDCPVQSQLHYLSSFIKCIEGGSDVVEEMKDKSKLCHLLVLETNQLIPRRQVQPSPTGVLASELTLWDSSLDKEKIWNCPQVFQTVAPCDNTTR